MYREVDNINMFHPINFHKERIVTFLIIAINGIIKVRQLHENADGLKRGSFKTIEENVGKELSAVFYVKVHCKQHKKTRSINQIILLTFWDIFNLLKASKN